MLDHDARGVTKTSELCGMTGREVCIVVGGSGMPKSSKILNWLPYRGRDGEPWSIGRKGDSVGFLHSSRRRYSQSSMVAVDETG